MPAQGNEEKEYCRLFAGRTFSDKRAPLSGRCRGKIDFKNTKLLFVKPPAVTYTKEIHDIGV
jgi:hypothetical protein